MNKNEFHSMIVGYYFEKEFSDDDRTEDWCGSEECSEFTKKTDISKLT